jgi:hypothetical protein
VQYARRQPHPTPPGRPTRPNPPSPHSEAEGGGGAQESGPNPRESREPLWAWRRRREASGGRVVGSARTGARARRSRRRQRSSCGGSEEEEEEKNPAREGGGEGADAGGISTPAAGKGMGWREGDPSTMQAHVCVPPALPSSRGPPTSPPRSSDIVRAVAACYYSRARAPPRCLLYTNERTPTHTSTSHSATSHRAAHRAYDCDCERHKPTQPTTHPTQRV